MSPCVHEEPLLLEARRARARARAARSAKRDEHTMRGTAHACALTHASLVYRAVGACSGMPVATTPITLHCTLAQPGARTPTPLMRCGAG